jgi:hypothetical protein
MALSADQRAMLELLLERGQSYDDLSSLLDLTEAEVRARARAALTELGGADPDRNVGLTDYLLGQADPIGRADAVRHLQSNPEDHQLASDLTAILREAFPSSELPRLPGEPRQPKRAKAAEGAPAGSRLPSLGLSQSQTRLIAILGAGAIILIAAVLGITGVFGGGDDSSPSSSDSSTDTTADASADQTLQRVNLTAPNGGDASGQAVFGLATGDQPYVDVSIKGLDPAPEGKTYVVWLLLTDTQGYPLSPIMVSDQGSFRDRFSIPSAVLPVVARVQLVDVSIAPVNKIRKLVKDAIQNTRLVLKKPGETVLQGEVPKVQQSQQSDSG